MANIIFLSKYSSFQNILELVGVIIVFFIILIAAYFAAVLVGKTQGNTYLNRQRNIKLIESSRISSNQLLQIVKIGNRYFALAVSKNHVERIAELSEDEVLIPENADVMIPFQNIFEKVKEKLPGNQKDNKQ